MPTYYSYYAMTEPLELKQKIVQTAIELYVDDRANFSIASVARKAGIRKAEIYRKFNSKGSILKYYYPLSVLRHKLMSEEIEDFNA